jgi:hypothetical protein
MCFLKITFACIQRMYKKLVKYILEMDGKVCAEEGIG